MTGTRRFCLLLLALTVPCVACRTGGADGTHGTHSNDSGQTFESSHLGSVAVLPGAVSPAETEKHVLSFMEENAALIEGKRVLEIGSASGMIGVWAAKLGARRVVATSFDEAALRNTKQNAERLGVLSVLETRLASRDDASAFSAIEPTERFDVIVSHPPYSLDLDAPPGTTGADTGDFGPSLVRGLDAHLSPGGRAILYYNSLFYHDVMVKLARYEGYDVRDHPASKMTPLEAEALFNHYLSRFLAHEGMETAAVRFDRRSDELGCIGFKMKVDPLVEGNGDRIYYGMIVIGRKADGTAAASERRPPPVSADGTLQGESRAWRTSHFDTPIVNLTGVFDPREADSRVLPFMEENAPRFRGKSVLEIGTGTGIISIYAAKLGAVRVVATDINETALQNADLNAERQGVASVVETRLVPSSDMSAYSVIAADETFDVIISNPPYSLDLEASTNTAVADTGDLGPSILRGLEAHLNPGGLALLYYNSLFYHHVMVKMARHMGFEVRNHGPAMMTPVETAALYNSYLARLLERRGLDRAAFDFVRNRDTLGCFGIDRKVEPLFAGNSSRTYPGMMVIQP